MTNAHYVAETHHNIPTVFWAFLNSVGPVREDRQVANQNISDPWFFATGLPISEAVLGAGENRRATKDMLIQAFERRILTYNPTNPAGFQVEMGNVGLHYCRLALPSRPARPLPTQGP